MNEQEWKKWEQDAFAVLTCTKYSAEDAEIIVKWFSSIKGRKERELVGDAFVDAFVDNFPMRYYSCYDTMMARLFVYAPYIIEEHVINSYGGK